MFCMSGKGATRAPRLPEISRTNRETFRLYLYPTLRPHIHTQTHWQSFSPLSFTLRPRLWYVWYAGSLSLSLFLSLSLSLALSYVWSRPLSLSAIDGVCSLSLSLFLSAIRCLSLSLSCWDSWAVDRLGPPDHRSCLLGCFLSSPGRFFPFMYDSQITQAWFPSSENHLRNQTFSTDIHLERSHVCAPNLKCLLYSWAQNRAAYFFNAKNQYMYWSAPLFVLSSITRAERM